MYGGFRVQSNGVKLWVSSDSEMRDLHSIREQLNIQCRTVDMSYGLNSLKGVIKGILLRSIMGVIKGDTRSVDCSSHGPKSSTPKTLNPYESH